MKDTRKGFTLVELLAVIVILAIIMIIAIPSVLQTMTTAQQKTFVEYVTRVYEAGQNQYLTQKSAGDLPSATNATAKGKKVGVYFVYDITKDVGLSSTGSYKGYVVVEPASGTSTDTKIYVMLYDNEYMTVGTGSTGFGFIDYTAHGEPLVGEISQADDTATAGADTMVTGSSLASNIASALV